MKIHFFVSAVPVAQPRQRHRIIKSKNGGEEFVMNYTPKSDPVNAFKASVAYATKQEYSGPVLDEPIGVYCVFVFPRPKYMVWKTKPMPREWLPKKPDDDNLEKGVWDALSGIIWRDDSLICRNFTEKCYASGSETPHVEIIIETLGNYYSKIGMLYEGISENLSDGHGSGNFGGNKDPHQEAGQVELFSR